MTALLCNRYDNLINTIASRWDDADFLTREAFIALLQSKAIETSYNYTTEIETLVFPNGREVYVQYSEWGSWKLSITE